MPDVIPLVACPSLQSTKGNDGISSINSNNNDSYFVSD